MVTTSRAPIRTDRLRPLNVPRQIQVKLTDIHRDSYERRGPASNKKDAQEGFAVPDAVKLDGGFKAVASIREIWEIEDEWWRHHIARRYFDVVLDGGKHTILYQDRLTGEWFSQSP